MRILARYKDDKGIDRGYLVENEGQCTVINTKQIKYLHFENAIVLRSGNVRATPGNYIETLNERDFKELVQRSNNSKFSSKVSHCGEVEIDIQHRIKVKLSENDVFNWLGSCNNVETLRYLGNYALKRAKSMESEDTDDFRSRA